jgi:head-tail adaptor
VKSINRRNQKATIQRVTLTTVGLGQTEAWADVPPDEWVCEEALNASETQQAAQLTGVYVTALSMPFRSDLLIKDRVVLGDRTLEIQGIPYNPRRDETRVLCAEVQA